MERTKEMQQVGVIVYGGGINARAWIDAAKQEGCAIVLRDGYCEIWRKKK